MEGSQAKEKRRQLKEMSKINCKNCGNEVSRTANFCNECGTKLDNKCQYCWVKKKDNYSCGELSCPGYKLFLLEKSKTKGFSG